MTWLAPPVPFVTVAIVVKPEVTLSETWTWNALPYAPSQFRATLQIWVVAPRSTWNHWSSAKALAQRVSVLPSTAYLAAVPSPSCDDAVAVLLRAALSLLQVGGVVVG